MSESTSTGGGDRQRTIQIPSLLTNSLRCVLDAFGSDIIQLTAHGSVETTNSTAVEDLRSYNVSREQRTHHRLSLDYEQIYSDEEPLNPLTDDACEQILAETEAVLDSESITVEPDLAVTSVTIRIRDDRLQEVTPAQTPEFDLRFVADPAEPPVREPTKHLNVDRGLYRDLGFNVTNLNLRSVVETQTKYTEQSDGRYLSWRGPDDIRPQSPKRLAIRINEYILPDNVGMLKPYTVIDDRVLEVSEEDLDEVDITETAGTAGSKTGGDE
jgi:hypothetical protein